MVTCPTSVIREGCLLVWMACHWAAQPEANTKTYHMVHGHGAWPMGGHDMTFAEAPCLAIPPPCAPHGAESSSPTAPCVHGGLAK